MFLASNTCKKDQISCLRFSCENCVKEGCNKHITTPKLTIPKPYTISDVRITKECKEASKKKFVPLFPELNSAKMVQFVAAHPVPKRKAVALVLRGAAFRGGGEGGEGGNRCSQSAVIFQAIASASHVKYMIEPPAANISTINPV